MIGPHDLDRIIAATAELDAVVLPIERKWGIDRLPGLCSAETLQAFKRGMTAWQQASKGFHAETVQRLSRQLQDAWRFMDVEAAERGHAPLAPEIWEAALPDGRVLRLVRTNAEARQIAEMGREAAQKAADAPAAPETVVWSLDEVVALVTSQEARFADVIKSTWPGARVQPRRGNGFVAAWLRADPISEGSHGIDDLREQVTFAGEAEEVRE